MNIFDSFNEGWQYTKKHGVILALLLATIYLLFNYLTLKCFPEEFWEEYTKIVTSGSKDMINDLMKLAPYFEQSYIKIWLVYFLEFLLMAGVLNIALTIHIGETKGISMKYLSLPFRTYMKVIQYGCIMMLLLFISIYLAFIPFIYIGIRLMFVLPILLEDPDCDFTNAARLSWRMTKRGFFNLLGFYLLCILVLVIGACFFLVGIFPAIVVCMFAFLALYKDGKIKYNKVVK